MISMKTNYKQNIKFIWILASFAVLLLRFDQCFESASNCRVEGGDMFFAMFCLSFPGSLLYLIFLALIFDPIAAFTPLHYFLLWGGAFIVGYLQWFWVVPRLLQGQGMTTLGLLQSGASTVCRAVSQHPSSGARRRKHSARLKGRRVAPFDETGRTPLERAISNNHI